VDKEAGIPYSCPAQRRHSHHNDNAGSANSKLGTLQQHQAQVRGPTPSHHHRSDKLRRRGPIDSQS
jgi:hypothetical protein